MDYRCYETNSKEKPGYTFGLVNMSDATAGVTAAIKTNRSCLDGSPFVV